MSYSPWDTSGPSQIADESFYLPGHRRGRGQAPNLTRGVRARIPKPPKVPRPKPPPLDMDALIEYIRQGHTAEQAAKQFGRSNSNIRRRLGPITKIRKSLCGGGPGREREFVHGRYMRFSEVQWEFLIAGGGAAFLRKLIDKEMGAQ